MRLEGKGQLPEAGPFALLLRTDHPLPEWEIADLTNQTRARVFSFSQLFRFSTYSSQAVYSKFKGLLGALDPEERVIFAYDLPRDSPLQLLGALFIRRWLKAMVRSGRPLHSGILASGEEGRILRLARPLDAELVARLQGWDRLRRYILTKLRMMDSALELPPFYHSGQREEDQAPIAEAGDPEVIRSEIAALGAGQCLCRQAEFEVWLARAEQIPETIQEIGRLRESTFRSVQEGTGKALDIDEYDLYYDQLIIWDSKVGCIVGGYRIGRGDEIFQTYGAAGFYINSLFRIDEGFYPIMSQSLELGRSYIIESYQRKRLPLFLLWKGILHLLMENPHYRYLYGPVSISSHYTDISRSLIIYFVQRHFFDKKLARFLRPRKQFKYPVNRNTLALLTEGMKGDLDKLNTLIEDIEPSHFRIPVLLRQYIRQNARFIAFNLDPHFSDALDGFIILDLRDVPQETLAALQAEKAPESE